VTIHRIDHYNLRAPREVLDRLRDWYRDAVGLAVGDRPPLNHFGYWLYADGRAVLHLSEAGAGESRPVPGTGTFDHVAFACEGLAETRARLEALGIALRMAKVPRTGQTQIFLKDPAGNGVELNFPPSDAG
jgi:catechol-2,3-dioxygenase